MTIPQLIARCREEGIDLMPSLEVYGEVPEELAEEIASQTDALIYHLLRPNVRPVRLPDPSRPFVALDRNFDRSHHSPGSPVPWDCVLWQHDNEVPYTPGPANIMGWKEHG